MTPPVPPPENAGEVLRALAPLLTDPSREGTFARATRLLASLSGARACALFLMEEDRVVSETWHPEPGGDEVGAGELAEAGRLAARRAETVRRGAGGDGAAVTAYPLLAHGRVLGAVCLAWPEPSPGAADDVCLPIVEMIACKTAGLRYTAEAEELRSRYERWFRTLDGQLRVLDRERQKFAAVVNQTDTSVFVADETGRITWANHALAKRFHVPEGSGVWVGKSCRDLCSQFEAACVECPASSVFTGNAVTHQEHRRVENGSVRNLYVTALPIRGPNGRPDEAMVMIQDLSGLEVLRRSEGRYRLLFDRSADAIVMADPESGAIVLANAMASQMTGYPPAELTGLTILDLHPPTEWRRVREHYAAVLAGETRESLECPIRTRDGRDLVVNFCGTRFDLDGKQVVMVEYRDVTTIRCLQAELARADKLITLGTMNAGIAHEFKNRLAPLRGFAELLSLREPTPERVREYAPLVVKEVDRLASLVRDVLDYARPQAPRQAPVDLGELMRGFTEELRHEMRDTLASLGADARVTVAGEEPIVVSLDGEQMRRVFINLFRNSIDAIRPGGWIETVVAREGETATVTISDTGHGISADHLPRIFDPFFSTKGVRGTGLGMCIVKALVEANDGAIRIGSEENVGTKVVLAFPLPAPGEERRAA